MKARRSRSLASRVFPRVLATALMSAWQAPGSAATEPVEFDSRFLMRKPGQQVDVGRFARGDGVVPGDYTVDVYVNGDWLGRRLVRFDGPGDQAVPCVDEELLDQMNLTDAARTAARNAGQGACTQLGSLIGDASHTFDLSILRLDLSVPQAALRRSVQGYVDPRSWDGGVTSATLAYDLNTYRTRGAIDSSSTYLGLQAGLNLGNWHLRQRSMLNWQSAGGYRYQNIATYLQRDLPDLRGQLTLGDAFTEGIMFDSIGFRGVRLASDDRMLPSSLRGYAPLIRGIAQSNARVEVSQNGNKLYETSVAPGPFEINDLYATGYGGELTVRVTEADGRVHSFAVPYASVAQLLRPGAMRYSVAVGQARDALFTGKDMLVQATVQRGFTNLLTGYAGAVAMRDYQSGLAGLALNTRVGAFALDLTQARLDKAGVAGSSGSSARLSYSKFVPSTFTNLTLAAYRFSSSGFRSLRDALQARAPGEDGPRDFLAAGRRRSELQLTLNQHLGEKWGDLYLSGSSRDYWDRGGRTTQFQAGYNNRMRLFGTSVAYTIAASRQRDGVTGRMSNQIYASMSLPLGRSPQAPMLSLASTSGGPGGSMQQALLNGSALEDNSLSYGLSASRGQGGAMAGGNVQYRARAGTVSASLSRGSSYTQYAMGLRGAVVAHPGGVTLANDLGETVGIVEAKDAKGARVTNAPGVRVDGRGYAVIPYLTPYALNSVELDPKGLPLDVELSATRARIAPRANSVVMVRFATVAGRSAMVTVALPDGSHPPFGASVRDASGAEVGLVGQGGRALVRGVADTGSLDIRWGEQPDARCRLDYRLPERGQPSLSYFHLKAVCTMPEVSTALRP
ncbi:fimbria/pilus outer membrane usher protein [Pigmentiphaga sp. YJ18]|uniref:fimbria/pilus outer membrane usher protein n=1 Tax=Pigmentiphaga sp. YJ18 TaxID=3134907 RepID=UPI0031182E62